MIELKINGNYADIDTNFEFRINRIYQQADDLQSQGGDTSTQLRLPKSKLNNRIFGGKNHHATVAKFNLDDQYMAELSYNGSTLLKGKLTITRITKNDYECELVGDNVSWIERLDNLTLCQIGYDENNKPTWLFPYDGYTTINDANGNFDGDVFFPTIIYNNTPITDYLSYTNAELFGTYDGSGNQISPPLDFPNAFKTLPAFFGNRQGLTYEDFPPAIPYGKTIERIFSAIGYNVKGDIFQQEWFKRLYMPFVGENPRWNYKNIAQLRTSLFQRNIDTTIGEPEILREVPSANIGRNFIYAAMNVPFSDDLGLRVDKIFNFKKGFIDPAEADRGAQYICPADGQYKINVFSNIILNQQGVPSTIDDLEAIGSVNPDYSWDDAVLIITRRNTSGDYVFFPEDTTNLMAGNDIFAQTAKWMLGENNDFMTNPSDIIAYYSPKRAQLYLNNDRRVSGSPLTNFESEVNTISNTFSSSVISINELQSLNGCEIEVTIDLLKNERINAYWVFVRTPVVLVQNNTVGNINYSSGANKFNVDYLCGEYDLDVAAQLPCESQKDFIANFIRRFNLSFSLTDNTITFYRNTYQNNTNLPYTDITHIIDDSDYQISPTPQHKRLILGYKNDPKDRLLNNSSVLCDGSSDNRTLEYANLTLPMFKNANSDLEIRDYFSATRFQKANIQLTDTDNYTPASVSRTDPFTLQVLTVGVTYTPPAIMPANIQLPVIQSRDSYNTATLGQLNYSWDYAPRLLYNLGRYDQWAGIGDEWRFIAGTPQISYILNLEKDFWLIPTVSAFDLENNNPYPSQRYDTSLYFENFSNLTDIYIKGEVLQAQCYLSNTLYRQLENNPYVLVENVGYKILEIIDYDITLTNPCTIKLIKLL